jgi:hypothetical protein
MRALSIHQPYTELILRGSPNQDDRVPVAVDQNHRRFYIYAARKPGDGHGSIAREFVEALVNGLKP